MAWEPEINWIADPKRAEVNTGDLQPSSGHRDYGVFDPLSYANDAGPTVRREYLLSGVFWEDLKLPVSRRQVIRSRIVSSREDAGSTSACGAEASIGCDGAVRWDFSTSQNKSRVPVMKPHLRLLAVNVIRSKQVERIIRADKATFETVTFHDSKSIVCWRTDWNPASNFTFKLDGVRREASCQ